MENGWYSGRHYILDLFGCDPKLLMDSDFLESICIESAKKAGATVLHSYFHHFGEDYGVTGVVTLSESHISIHTWPETNYAALDIFMCGKCDPKDAADFIIGKFNPTSSKILPINRGEQ